MVFMNSTGPDPNDRRCTFVDALHLCKSANCAGQVLRLAHVARICTGMYCTVLCHGTTSSPMRLTLVLVLPLTLSSTHSLNLTLPRRYRTTIRKESYRRRTGPLAGFNTRNNSASRRVGAWRRYSAPGQFGAKPDRCRACQRLA